MKRRDAMDNLLISIFGKNGNKVVDNKITNDQALSSKCTFTCTTYRVMRELFQYTLLNDNNDETEMLSARAEKYLKDHGIHIYNSIPAKARKQLMFSAFDLIIKTIAFGCDKSAEKRGEEDITEELEQCFLASRLLVQYEANRRFPLHCLNEERGLSESKNDEQEFQQVYIYTHSSIALFQLFAQMSVYLPPPASKPENKDEISSKDLPGKAISFPLFMRSSRSEVPISISISKSQTISDFISDSDCKTLYNAQQKLNAKNALVAEKEVDESVSDLMAPFYKTLSQEIAEFLKMVFNNLDLRSIGTKTINKNEFYSMILRRCQRAFGDFSWQEKIINSVYGEDKIRGIYVTLQNAILTLAEGLDQHGEELAHEMKNKLTTEEYSLHQKQIKAIHDNKSLEALINTEQLIQKNNKELFSEPECESDFFFSIRKDTFSYVKYSLYKYHSALKMKKREITKIKKHTIEKK